ncbi:MAG: hypothetical protein SPL15_00425 [Lachnospiraceae bacterium]|nr:hypothetical protein [Lachnospiraceae bacterium]MDY5741454.1 hypothetical protein [Lachnospiraceae bacterium]
MIHANPFPTTQKTAAISGGRKCKAKHPIHHGNINFISLKIQIKKVLLNDVPSLLPTSIFRSGALETKQYTV